MIFIIIFLCCLGGFFLGSFLHEHKRREHYQGLAHRWKEAYEHDVKVEKPDQLEGDEWKKICGYE